MALSEHEINMNFELAKAQAEKLDTVADELLKLSDVEFENVMQSIAMSWKGENAKTYLDKGQRLQEKMTMTAQSLHGVAGEIRTKAQNIYAAEMAAYLLAKARNIFN